MIHYVDQIPDFSKKVYLCRKVKSKKSMNGLVFYFDWFETENLNAENWFETCKNNKIDGWSYRMFGLN